MNETGEIKPAGPLARFWLALRQWINPPVRPMTPEEFRLTREVADVRQANAELTLQNKEWQHENKLLRQEIDNLNMILHFHHERWEAEAATEARRAVLVSTQMPGRPGYPGG